MSNVSVRGGAGAIPRGDLRFVDSSPARQAYWILYAGFIAAPIIAGADKFIGFLVNWDIYLAPQIARLMPFPAHTLMLIVGAIEIAAGLLVALKPRIGGVVVGLWLVGIIGNLLTYGRFLDIALRDLGLALGAFALARLAAEFDRDVTVT